VSWHDDFDEDWMHGDDEETPLVRCPNCCREIYREADSCPHCGEFLISDPAPLDSKRKWFVMLGLLGMLAVVLVLSGLLGML
jgi:hypothetical protein